MKKLAAILKNIFTIVVLLALFSASSQCQDPKKEKEAAQEALVKKMVTAKSYIIEVQSTLPAGGRSKQLSPGYLLKLSGDSLVSYLPYFGKAYSPAGVSEGGYNFTSTNFEYTSTDRKKGGWDIKIKTKDQQQNPEILLTIFENGNASFKVTSMSRQTISYSGYLSENK